MQDAPHQDLPAAGAHHELSTAPQSRLPRNLVGLTIVVVDDDEASRDYFAIALRSCGASVLTASTARDALRLVQEQRPDVVLSDIAMSEHDGYWLASEIRRLAEPAASRVPIVAATAYGREHSRERALAAGFIEHLQKPVDPELLARTIAQAAQR
jgi:CheY-like chemotaxis protein